MYGSSVVHVLSPDLRPVEYHLKLRVRAADHASKTRKNSKAVVGMLWDYGCSGRAHAAHCMPAAG